MNVTEHAGRLQLFMQQLEQAAYYEAHESLEAIWFPRRFEEDAEIRLLKGFINAAVSFELIKRGRPEPSKRAWKNYVKYRCLLDEVESEHLPLYRTMAEKVESIRSQYE